MNTSSRHMGRLGVGGRLVFGFALLALAIVGLPPIGHLLDWRQIVLGMVVLPTIVTALQLLRLAFTHEQLCETGGLATAINCVAVVGLIAIPATRDIALVFLGASLLVAAVRGYRGCETLALSNWMLRRDDQVGCLIFSPLDRFEAQLVERDGASSRPGSCIDRT